MSVCLCAEKHTVNMDSIMVMCHLLPYPSLFLDPKRLHSLTEWSDF